MKENPLSKCQLSQKAWLLNANENVKHKPLSSRGKEGKGNKSLKMFRGNENVKGDGACLKMSVTSRLKL